MLTFLKKLALGLGLIGFVAAGAQAAPADDVIFDMSQKILKDLKSDAGLRSGNKQAVGNYVDAHIMPKVDFSRWVASAVGSAWNQASPSDQNELMQVMRHYFVSTYSGRLVKNDVTAVDVYPVNGGQVKSLVKHSSGKQDTVVYYMENQGGTWRIYDMSIGGVRVSNTYRGQFKNTVNRGGVSALIAELKAKTK